MIDKENKKTLGKKIPLPYEGKILIHCGGNIHLLGIGVTRLVLRCTPPPALVSRDCVATFSSSGVGVL